ncbi:uncharacterized protein Z520_03971 [Fonsecaea multimorphosa CBS 102226]|uniref:Glycosyltransferase 2-like domain-containing protein n=1 Tax=Fonsecaea multimorphosa CBS 102226 TaxID=1442371 RepID=A0A0D2HEH1_9EURO|nr:uncharacterized protein Z520_03971 [Fonsecaea multimorphosa CBS 102226]KIY00286.1 hypothetical protein Z520_03971 [Fonsecaea multimorphosa CBS 102226]OAL27119.1 hypothetical protein AYO22_03750 [Fonsecaea multimorphosa]
MAVDPLVPVAEHDSGVRHRAVTIQTNNDDGNADNVKVQAPYRIVEVEKKQPYRTSLFSLALTGINVISICAYLGVLFLNVLQTWWRGHGLPKAPYLFALGQLYDNMSSILDGSWRIVVGLVRDSKPRPTLRILGTNVPGIDVFVTCCGEPDDVVLDTVKAVCKLDWPEDKFRVVVADDGNMESLRLQIEKLQERYPNLYYHARKKPTGKNHGYKAGNLNQTMREFVIDLPGGQNDFLAVFDADMMPEPQFLRALVPHALGDIKIGMVTAAQHHYNIPNDDPLNQGNSTGTAADDGLRDSVNVAWCPGSGFIMRKEAWTEIGGFPEFSITEDLITSWFLHGKGWKIVLIHEVLQWGLQPDCILTHLKQRRRWWTGHIRDALSMNFTLYDTRLKEASRLQRLAMLHHSCRPYLMTLTKLANSVIAFVCLYHGRPVIATPSRNALYWAVMLFGITRMLELIGDIKSVFGRYYLSVRRRVATGVWMGHHFSRDVLQTLLPKRLGGLRLGFGVSGVGGGSVKERDVNNRPPLFQRLWDLHRREGILWHVVLFFVMSIVVIFRVHAELKAAIVDGEFISDKAFWLRFIASVGFPGLALLETIPLYLTPVVYAIWPPTMPERRDSMVYDDKIGLWKPMQGFKGIKYTAAS